jgi:hypothetical protein
METSKYLQKKKRVRVTVTGPAVPVVTRTVTSKAERATVVKTVKTVRTNTADDDGDAVARVVRTYTEILKRMPTKQEIVFYARDPHASAKERRQRLKEIETRLRRTNEYRRLVLAQSNDTNAEVSLRRTDRTSELMIAELYRQVYRTTPSPEVLSFLKERFDALNEDHDAFTRYLLALHRTETAQLPSRPDLFKFRFYGTAPAVEKKSCVAGEADGVKLTRRQVQRRKQDLVAGCDRLTNVDGFSGVLRPEFQWSVPQRRPPVCIPTAASKAKVTAQTDQTALIGTLLPAAFSDTQVGSLMPKFVYKELK